MKIKKLRVLVACEFSQIVTKAFRDKGHEAYSCDIIPTDGNPEWHIQDDVLSHLNDDWDMMIAFPPCPYLTVTANKWYFHPDDKQLPMKQRRPHPRFPDRQLHRQQAIEFFMALANADIPKIAIENPVGIMSTRWRKPDQITCPTNFGHKEPKKTCLWLKNLPLLKPTKIVEPEYYYSKSGKRLANWYYLLPKTPERQKIRNTTFQGVAEAMSTQWSNL